MSGFIYLWYDRKHKRFYIGSHWGQEDDGYICSSNWMIRAYHRRPEDFKRRILARVLISRKDLIEEENRWLSMIKPEEIKIRYYNLRIAKQGYWFTDERSRMSVAEKISKSNTGKKFTGDLAARNKKIGEANRGKVRSQEMKENLSKKLLGRTPSEDVVAKRVAAQKERWKKTPRKKNSPESIEKMRQSLTGSKLTPEHIANRSAAQTGKKRSPDSCKRISEGEKPSIQK